MYMVDRYKWQIDVCSSSKYVAFVQASASDDVWVDTVGAAAVGH